MRALAVLPLLLGGCQLVFKLEADPDAAVESHLFTRTIHVTQTSGQAQVDFPISVVLDQDAGLRDHAATDGTDIRFFDPTLSTELPAEIGYDGTTGTLDAWVRIADLSTQPFDILLVYGDTKTRTTQATDTWSDAFIGVWHLSETSGNALDSTSHAITLSPSGTSPVTMAGSVGRARFFDGNMDRLCALDANMAQFSMASFSFGVWTLAQTTGINQPHEPIDKGRNNVGDDGWGLEIEAAGTIALAYAGDGSAHTTTTSTSPVMYDQWAFWRGQYNRTTGKLSLFVDGIADSEMPLTGIATIDPTDKLCLSGQANLQYKGVLDEVRIYNGIQTAQWINAEYANVHDRASFLTIGDETQR